ncbi:MAG TPA: phage portal protein [Pyrinomonadaceae bacterium]|nr:phage portal protein [Pyrinomonadaceae bacterium]
MFEKLKTQIARWLGSGTKALKRTFTAARVNRLTSEWIYGPTNTNQILRGDLRRLRERSEDLARNNPYARKFLHLLRNNIVGKGFTLQVRPSGKSLKTDRDLASLVENAFYQWGKRETCSASGKLCWVEACQLFVRHLAVSGEALVRFVRDSRNPWRFSLRFYSPAWLDENYNDTLQNGNRVIMSVEVDDNDRPVAYYFTQPVGEWQRRQPERRRTRVPAEEVIHAFICEEGEDQARGIPWMHAAAMRLRMFDAYEEAELVGKRTEACQMAFVIPPMDDASPTPATEDDEGNRIQSVQEMEPGVISELPPGYSLQPLQPKQDPGARDFKKTALRGGSAGLDVSYHSLAGDLEAVNYSSAKIGGLEERDNYANLQQFVIRAFCEPVYRAWLEAATLTKMLDLPAKSLERVREPFFRGRGWTWVEPLKEANAYVIGLENKFFTITDILADRGIDVEDHFETIRKERELAESYGIDLTFGKPAAEAPAPPAD